MVFGQVVIGPPGSGKTTYCNGMSQFLSLLGRYAASLLTSSCSAPRKILQRSGTCSTLPCCSVTCRVIQFVPSGLLC